MKVVSFPSKTTPYRIQLPGRYSPDRKRKSRYFATKDAAESFLKQVKNLGLVAVEPVKSPKPLNLTCEQFCEGLQPLLQKPIESKTLFSLLDKRKTVTMGELAELTGFPVSTLRHYVARGEIFGAMRSGKGRWRFERQALEHWWQS